MSSTHMEPGALTGPEIPEAGIEQASILIVDDDPMNCRVLEALLGQEGYLTLSVNSGKEALDSIAAWPPDLILLDAMMPAMSGYEVARILKSSPDTMGIPIIMVTAKSGHASKMSSLEAGVEGHLTKPVHATELRLRVRTMLRLKSTADQLQSQSDLLAEQVLKSNRELRQFSVAMDSTLDIVALVDRASMKFVQVNAAAVRVLGYSREELLTMGPDQVMEATREQLEHVYDELIEGRGDGTAVEMWLRSRDGLLIRFEVNRHVIPNGDTWTIVVVARDITERKSSEEKMRQLAYYDTLTELPNRTLFDEHLEQSMQQADAWNLQLVLIYLDLDHFRTLNETLGHSVGDALLQQISQRLPACLYPRDHIARLGSDEFAVIALTPRDPLLAVSIANKVLDAMRVPFQIEGHVVHQTASLGMALYSSDTADPRSLFRFADLAMDAAKHDGRNRARFYTGEMNLRAQSKLELETALRGALDRGEFVLYYQPKVSLRTGAWTGVEALLRWERPGHGLVLPGVFIGALEATGMIVPVGTWALEAACRQLTQWAHSEIGPLPIAVNVSALQLVGQEPSIQLAELAAKEGRPAPETMWSTIAGCLQGLTLPQGLLEIEITESTMMADAERNVGMLHQLKEMGIRLSLDDFGTGYSSLSYLARFPLDAVKIDGSFIRGVTTTAHDAAITQAIIEMAHQLGMKVVAECVETAEQVEFLRAHGCDEAQGFYFACPMPVDELERFWTEGGGVRTQAAFALPCGALSPDAAQDPFPPTT